MPVSLYRFSNIKACSFSKSVVHIQFMKFFLVSSIIFPMSYDEASLNCQGVGEKKYPRLFVALAVFHPEWRCIVRFELKDSKQLDDAEN